MKPSITKSRLKQESEYQATITNEIDINLPDEVIIKLSLEAHKRNVTLNKHINDIIISNLEKLNDGPKPEFLTEDKT